jgi:hypothetical protein
MINQTDDNNNSYLLIGQCFISPVQRDITMPNLLILSKRG